VGYKPGGKFLAGDGRGAVWDCDGQEILYFDDPPVQNSSSLTLLVNWLQGLKK
jgi:hypothetical protein